MSSPGSCPHCDGVLRPPGLMASAWSCERHGEVLPLHVATRVSPESLEHTARTAHVPLWAPAPPLPGWSVSGLATAGDDRSGTRATVLALSGPGPLGGPADLLLVAEEPGVGVGARYAGAGQVDIPAATAGSPDAKVHAAGHPTGLWCTDSAPDRCAFVGEAGGLWLWAVLWPASAELVLLEHLQLADLREDPGRARTQALGAPCPHL